MSLASARERTIAYSRGYSCSVTGFDRVVAMAILSENQYMARLMPRPKASPMARPPTPWNSTSPSNTKSPPRPAMSTQVLTLFTSVPFLVAPDRLEADPSYQRTTGPRKGGRIGLWGSCEPRPEPLPGDQRGQPGEVGEQVREDAHSQDAAGRRGDHPPDRQRDAERPDRFGGRLQPHGPHDGEVVHHRDHGVDHHGRRQPRSQAPPVDGRPEDEELPPEAGERRDPGQRDEEYRHRHRQRRGALPQAGEVRHQDARRHPGHPDDHAERAQ